MLQMTATATTAKCKQELTNQSAAFPQQVAGNKACFYSDFCRATCCATLQQPMSDVQLVAPQQSCATKVCNKLLV